MRGLGLTVVFSAIAVLAPRLAILFAEADGVPVGGELRSRLLGGSSVALAVVLTGGAAYLAHSVARSSTYRGLLLTCWLALLGCIAVLLTPLLAGTLDGSELSRQLAAPWARWLWSAVAALAPELVAAGAMVALAADELDREQREELGAELEQVARERNRLQQRLDQVGQQPPAAAQVAPDRVPCRNGCGGTFRSVKAEAGHQRACPARPDREE